MKPCDTDVVEAELQILARARDFRAGKETNLQLGTKPPTHVFYSDGISSICVAEARLLNRSYLRQDGGRFLIAFIFRRTLSGC
jgi:hypothetical protein